MQSKADLYYWITRQKIATGPTITSNQKESGGGQGKLSLSIGLDIVSEKSTKNLYGREVLWRNELVDVGPTSPLSSRYFCVDYLIEQGKWIYASTCLPIGLMTLMSMLMLTPKVSMSAEVSGFV